MGVGSGREVAGRDRTGLGLVQIRTPPLPLSLLQFPREEPGRAYGVPAAFLLAPWEACGGCINGIDWESADLLCRES